MLTTVGKYGAPEDYVNWLRAGGCTVGTIKVRASYVGRFLDTVPDYTHATQSDLAEFLCNPAWSPETRKSARTSMRVFFGWLAECDYIEKDPTKGLRAVRVPRALPRPADEDALTNALSNCVDAEERLAVLLAAYAGLRRAEIAQLHCDDIRGGFLNIVRAKGGHARRIPIHPELWADLQVAYTRGGWVFRGRFPGTHRHPDWVGRRLAQLLPGDLTGHTLRHRFASRAFAKTHNLRAVQELLGHSSIATTERYTLVDDAALTYAVMAL